MDTTACRRSHCWSETTLIDTRSPTSYHDKFLASLKETLYPADTIWVSCQSKVSVFGRPLLWAICFFFCPLIADVISMVQIMCQLTSISSCFILWLMCVMLRCLRRLAPLRRACCLTYCLALR